MPKIIICYGWSEHEQQMRHGWRWLILCAKGHPIAKSVPLYQTRSIAAWHAAHWARKLNFEFIEFTYE